MARPRQPMSVVLTLDDAAGEPFDLEGTITEVIIPRAPLPHLRCEVTLRVMLRSEGTLRVLREAQAGTPPPGRDSEEG